jgi:hypothetical protein
VSITRGLFAFRVVGPQRQDLPASWNSRITASCKVRWWLAAMWSPTVGDQSVFSNSTTASDQPRMRNGR